MKSKQKMVSINIKITKEQRDWLAAIASQVRENNEKPVSPADRVFPQHLVGVAIDLLKNSGVDWNQIRSTQDLRKHLNL